MVTGCPAKAGHDKHSIHLFCFVALDRLIASAEAVRPNPPNAQPASRKHIEAGIACVGHATRQGMKLAISTIAAIVMLNKRLGGPLLERTRFRARTSSTLGEET